MISRDGTGAKVALRNGHELILSRLTAFRESETGETTDGFEAMVMLRPEHIEIEPPRNGALGCTVRRIQFLGSFIRYVTHCAEATREVIVDSPRIRPVGPRIWASTTPPTFFDILLA